MGERKSKQGDITSVVLGSEVSEVVGIEGKGGRESEGVRRRRENVLEVGNAWEGLGRVD